MKLLRKLFAGIGAAVGGFGGLTTFLMVADELRYVDLYYCPAVGVAKCTYPYPVIGIMNIWDAWALDFGLIAASAVVFGIGAMLLGMAIQEVSGTAQ